MMTGLMKDPATNVVNHVRILKDGDEIIGLDNAPLGMSPPHECLEPGGRSAGQIEYGLKDQKKLVGRKGFTQVHL